MAGLPGQRGDKGEKVKYQLNSLFQICVFGFSFLNRIFMNSVIPSRNLPEHRLNPLSVSLWFCMWASCQAAFGCLTLGSPPSTPWNTVYLPGKDVPTQPVTMSYCLFPLSKKKEVSCMLSVTRIFLYHAYTSLLMDRILCSGFILAVISRRVWIHLYNLSTLYSLRITLTWNLLNFEERGTWPW